MIKSNTKKLLAFFKPKLFQDWAKDSSHAKLNTNAGILGGRVESVRGNKPLADRLIATKRGFSAAKVSLLTTPFIPIFSSITAMINTSSLHNDSKIFSNRQVQFMV